MPSRRLPRTDEERCAALNMLTSRTADLTVGHSPLSPVTAARLHLLSPEFYSLLESKRAIESRTSELSDTLIASRKQLWMVVGHYHQALRNAVARGAFNPADAVILDMRCGRRPSKVGTDANLTVWAKQTVDAEEERLKAGHPPVTMPGKEELESALHGFKLCIGSKTTLQKELLRVKRESGKLRRDIDGLILRAWNEVEASFSDLDIGARRRASKEWGVVYIPSRGEAPFEEGNISPGHTVSIDCRPGTALCILYNVGDTALECSVTGREALVLEVGNEVEIKMVRGSCPIAVHNPSKAVGGYHLRMQLPQTVRRRKKA